MFELNKIYQMDCLEYMDGLIKQGVKVDAIITSPPYYNAREYSFYETYEDYLLFIKKVFVKSHSLLKSDSFLIINVSPVIEPRASRNKKSKRYPIPFDIVSILTRNGFEFIDDIIWEKPEGAAPNRNGGFCRTRKPKSYKPNNVTEYILVFQRDDSGLIDKYLKNNSLVKGDYERSNIWKINPETKSEHTAPFPLDLPTKLCRYYTYENDTVLDCFMGSGTTAVAAKQTKRNFYGCELDPNYIAIANKRLEQVQGSLF